MSKQIDATIRCPKCGHQYPVKLYRTIWGEYQENRNLVMSGNINKCTCPKCGFSFVAPYPFMYVDIKAGFAVWWVPTDDPNIETETAAYSRMFGPRSFYSTAPRITDWEEFKETIRKYYRGELIGGPVEKFDISAITPPTKRSGCFGLLVPLIIIFGLSVFLSKILL